MADHSPVAGTSNRFNESRFDLYARNRSNAQWNDEPKRGDSYSYADERDRYAQRNTIDHSAAVPERVVRYRGDSPSSFQGNSNPRSSLPRWQPDPYSSGQHNPHRMPDNCWNNFSSSQPLPDRNSFASYSRQDRSVPPSHGPVNSYGTGSAGSPGPSGSSCPSGSSRMPNQCNPSKHSLLPDPFPPPSRNSFPGTASQSSTVSGYHHQQSGYLNQKAVNSKPQVIPPTRREDPRLANRNKKLTQSPQETRTNSYQSHQPHQSQSHHPHQSQSHQSQSHQSQSHQPHLPYKAANAAADSKATEASELEVHGSRSSDNFVSPLGSLYGNSSKTGQTGRGYGVQNYKIPKKKAEPKRTDAPIEDNVSTVTPSDEPTKDVSIEKEPAPTSELPSIDRNVLESYIKKALPSDDAAKLLEKMREMEQVNETTEKEESSSSKTESNHWDDNDRSNERADSPVVDATVTSSGDSLIINEDADEADTSNVQEVADDIQKSASDIQEPTSDIQEPTSDISEKESPKKKGRRKKTSSVMSEVVRLQEDVTDFMRNVGDLQGKRRSRSRVQRCTDSISGDDLSESISLNDSELEKERSTPLTPVKRKTAIRNKNKSPSNVHLLQLFWIFFIVS